ncbi:disease resistance protein RPM1 [Trifolium repens]|nr:disease resistance protein RPM1 [Trifolium repens]
MAVSLVVGQLIPLLREEAKLFRGIHKEFTYIKDELESIQAFLKDADKRAEGDNTSEGVKTWVKQVRELAFRIEDIIDDYLIKVVPQPRDHPRCVALLHKLKTMTPRHQIAYEIQDIKSSVIEISERSKRYDFQRSFEQGSSNSRGGRNATWHDPRLAALYIEEAEVVGFEIPRKTLIEWMVKQTEERTVVSVVGMGGQGKTTLAKKVFDDKDIIRHFDCRVWITVSQSYNIEELLRDMLLKFYKQRGDNAGDISQMNRASLIDEVRNYLQEKRYVVVFDDVWSSRFWDHIELALFDNKNGSKILITTRNLDVIVPCKRSSSSVEVLELEPLTQEQSLELFNKKAFRFDYGGCCPKELIDISYEIVKKCKGLPLAIVVIGGLLSTREKNVFQWQRFRENLSLELKKDTHLSEIKEILGLSYNDLPYYLKPCLLYFGIYPEDYEVKSKRVTRQWIAEGFVKEERGKTLEEVAKEYLTELIHRSLVQVSSLRFNGKAKGCRIHDLIRSLILEKIEDLNFCKHISEDGQSSSSGITRRLSITTISNDLIESTESSHIRSLFFFIKSNHDYSLTQNFAKRIPRKYRLLKVLDYESFPLMKVPKKLGNFYHLKYLSFRHAAAFEEVPKSIGMLQNLETLDVRHSQIRELPNEIRKLRKLRHLRGHIVSLIKLKDGIGEMTSLQTLSLVLLDIDGFKELGKLKQMRVLGLCVDAKYGSTLASALNEMQHLEKLNLMDNPIEVHDLDLISSPKLQKLELYVRLQKLPVWIPELQNLVVLSLVRSNLTKDPMESLKCLQHLLFLTLENQAYEGLYLHVEAGGFQKLKELHVIELTELQDIVIDKGALPSLKKLSLSFLLSLKNIPNGIKHLEKLEVLHILNMQVEFVQHNSTEDWIMEHVPFFRIQTIGGNVIKNSRS